ncbi:HAMP domain-containing histidine kinase [Psychrosphaera sp. B3R10]|uniref:sensor histidine kinase n=1 Tax=unclassified Psychrosphaera TaxID=2641570 RepID=UPI001C089FD3|nr:MULTISPECIES: HAMP domain-containing sensor histidine kinase [unclassified Psychrosphaera]MBU2883607.1 HAMP domain-containing histidine kinase [Psychrosphaera sp. I2R16]MBU2989785.1 HAMP domain-containing histidine kinase [Psychrosphaera sp. B3R10]
MSLYKRLVLSLSLVFAAIIYLVVWWSGELKENTQLESEQRLHLGLAEHLVTDNPLLAQGVYDYDALKGLFHTLMMLGPSFEFYYVDTQGKIITYSADPGKVKRTHIDTTPIKSVISNRINTATLPPQNAASDTSVDTSVDNNLITSLPILGDDPRQVDHQKIFSAAPVLRDGELQGYLYIIIRGENYDSIMQAVKANNQFGESSIIAAISLAVMLLLLLGLFRYFTLPLCKISNAIKGLSNENWETQKLNLNLTMSQDNELQLVVTTINTMLGQIQKQFSQLQNIDEQRRVLLADLSHDLRTPLASLQGYIETLHIHGEKLSAVERSKFIDISMKNSKNLKLLIDQIFELAYLEGGQVTLQNESVALGELIYDVAAKFELKAAAKRINITVDPAECNYQIFADIGKLERVLSNLIDNAIRHTPENGEITLSVAEHSKDGKKLEIAVKDTGIGINQNELTHIFNARYRASNSQEDKQSHAGLGLAISQKLVQLFNSELSVESQLGKGTRFSFEVVKTQLV